MLEQIVQYYTNLLIIQYNNQPNARATIEALVRLLIAENLALQIKDAFDVDSAVGAQLDTIGKYVGVDRTYIGQNIEGDYFSLLGQNEAPPDPSRLGFIDQSDWTSDDGRTLIYDEIVTTRNKLNDEDYRFLIKLKILFNTSNVSKSEIDTGLNDTFGDDIQADSEGDMKMTYIANKSSVQIAKVALQKNVLPKPAAVGVTSIIEKSEDMFALVSYDYPDQIQGFTGFGTQATFGSDDSETLTYNKIIEV